MGKIVIDDLSCVPLIHIYYYLHRSVEFSGLDGNPYKWKYHKGSFTVCSIVSLVNNSLNVNPASTTGFSRPSGSRFIQYEREQTGVTT